MENFKKFTQSEMTTDQEQKFMEELYERHYDEKLKKEYTEKLASKFNITRENEGTSGSAKKTGTIRYLLMGASAIAAIFALVFVFMPMLDNRDGLNPNQYAQSLITIDKIDVKRGGQSDSQLRLEIVDAYNEGRWSDVYDKYDQLETLNSEDLYHKGRLLLYQNKYKEAIAAFTQISDAQSFKYSTELEYWLGIAYFSNQEFDKAKPLLEQTAKSGWKSEEVRRLLEAMK